MGLKLSALIRLGGRDDAIEATGEIRRRVGDGFNLPGDRRRDVHKLLPSPGRQGISILNRVSLTGLSGELQGEGGAMDGADFQGAGDADGPGLGDGGAVGGLPSAR